MRKVARQIRYDERPRRYRTDPKCKAKRYYVDEVGARAGALIALKEIGNRRRLWVYKCRHCDGWHLTHNDQGAARKVVLDAA